MRNSYFLFALYQISALMKTLQTTNCVSSHTRCRAECVRVHHVLRQEEEKEEEDLSSPFPFLSAVLFILAASSGPPAAPPSAPQSAPQSTPPAAPEEQ